MSVNKNGEERKTRRGKIHNPNNKMKETIKILLIKKDKKIKDLAEYIGCDSAGMNWRLKKNDFDESEMRDIAEFFGCDLEINFRDRESGNIIS